MTVIDRALSLLDDPDADGRPQTIRAFEAIFALTLAAEYWARGIPKWSGLSWQYIASAIAVTALVLPALSARWRRPAFAAMGLIHAYIGWREFPETSNHSYLEVELCALAALLDVRRQEERVLFLRAVRWAVCVIFFYSGLQKLLHGHWTHGQYLAFSISKDAYRKVLSYLLPESELVRLTSYAGVVGDGPYDLSGLLMLTVVNVVWLLEMLLPALLVMPRTRPIAVIACVVLMLAIETAAREIFFGLVFLNAILLFTRRDAHRWLIVPVGVVLFLLLLSRLGVLPPMTFT